MLTVQRLTKSFGSTKAVDDLSFSIAAGEIVGFLGPNGAGKTTTMRLIAGYLSPDSGKILIDNKPVGEEGSDARRHIGYLPENNPLYRDMLVSEFLTLSADLKGIPSEKRAEAFDFAVRAVDIGDVYYRPVGELSKGYKQRVGMAVALLHRPSILILDEPTEGLDPNQRTEIRTLIKSLAKDRTILLSTHVMQEATVFPGQQDLEFVNDTGNPLLIQSWSDGDEAFVNILGVPDGRETVLSGPYFASNAPEDVLVNGRKMRKNEIVWLRSVKMEGMTAAPEQELRVARYQSIPKSLPARSELTTVRNRPGDVASAGDDLVAKE